MTNALLSVCNVSTIAATLLCSAFQFVGSDDAQELDPKKKYDDITVYEQRFEEFNKKHGTDFEIPPETALGGPYSEIVDFYTSMTIEEIDNYLMSIYDGSIYSSDDESIKATGVGKPVTN